jgi:hypothetical protein
MIKTRYVPKGGKNPMANVVKKHSDANHGSWYEYHEDFVFETNRFLDESDRIATVTSSAAAD